MSCTCAMVASSFIHTIFRIHLSLPEWISASVKSIGVPIKSDTVILHTADVRACCMYAGCKLGKHSFPLLPSNIDCFNCVRVTLDSVRCNSHWRNIFPTLLRIFTRTIMLNVPIFFHQNYQTNGTNYARNTYRMVNRAVDWSFTLCYKTSVHACQGVPDTMCGWSTLESYFAHAQFFENTDCI